MNIAAQDRFLLPLCIVINFNNACVWLHPWQCVGVVVTGLCNANTYVELVVFDELAVALLVVNQVRGIEIVAIIMASPAFSIIIVMRPVSIILWNSIIKLNDHLVMILVLKLVQDFDGYSDFLAKRPGQEAIVFTSHYASIELNELVIAIIFLHSIVLYAHLVATRSEIPTHSVTVLLPHLKRYLEEVLFVVLLT